MYRKFKFMEFSMAILSGHTRSCLISEVQQGLRDSWLELALETSIYHLSSKFKSTYLFNAVRILVKPAFECIENPLKKSSVLIIAQRIIICNAMQKR